ncbi:MULTISPECIES: amino acid ABC transporter substrate-binding protein [Bosea]|uniref:amino acid ABC transporter substrate-binding protein n=1 Tax=Bosea TaxID=85413 RepID=UPI00214F9D2E|nr:MULTISPECIES: amino acid ABC transporter substrate-binding protein [Bosea]MCR4523966.1 amino acid ABC transporter substrate-binding protein [Bosea sp. 47.2.35]MDR6831061.1 general L-amino acid transport system substrate-binding protein [Bosea robiniae]MDR6897748.1 general L-amino acid transport system substrate-binding protein [Bosea sp. BE109]MDR7141145.1 general L-amino acid transport system substrate-binding protein [Bosea sp. BE168]MDR7177718.1 general L-amino acid transport system subs
MKTLFTGLGAALTAACLAAQPAAADTLKTIRDRGKIICGTSTGVAGFSTQDANGRWQGFDIDICRALAVVIFNDTEKASFVPLTSKDRLIALQAGEVDVLPRTTTWTLARNSGQGVTFTGVNYYDGQGFMVPKKLGVASASKLDGASICVAQGTTSELNLADYFRRTKMKYEVAAFGTSEDALKAYESGRCDAYTTDVSALSANLLKFRDPGEHLVLPEVISKEPLGPWVRSGDDTWFNLVRWTLFALINAEELGVTKANVRELAETSANPEIRRFLGKDGKYGEALGVSNDWTIRIIAAVGNYGESFERNLGMNSPMKLQRGPNALWTEGGLQYSPPFR